MATILFNNTNTVPIPYYSKNNCPIHNPNGIDASILKAVLWEHYMILFANSYNAEKNYWQNIQNIANMSETELVETLTVHSYDSDISEKYKRKFTTTKLVDLIELDLKNTNNYLQAIKTFIGLV